MSRKVVDAAVRVAIIEDVRDVRESLRVLIDGAPPAVGCCAMTSDRLDAMRPSATRPDQAVHAPGRPRYSHTIRTAIPPGPEPADVKGECVGESRERQLAQTLVILHSAAGSRQSEDDEDGG